MPARPYSALARRGYFPPEELLTLRFMDSRLQGHPYAPKTLGLDATTGSLGNGVSVGLGMALAARIRSSTIASTSSPATESWAKAHLGSRHVRRPPESLQSHRFVDNNNYQSGGTVGEVTGVYPIEDKWRSFG